MAADVETMFYTREKPHKRELNEKLHEMNNIVYFNSKTL